MSDCSTQCILNVSKAMEIHGVKSKKKRGAIVKSVPSTCGNGQLMVVRNSALYEHLQEAGYSCDDIAPETLASVVDSVKHSLQKEQPDSSYDSWDKGGEQDEHECSDEYPRKRYKFSMKLFLLGLLRWLLGINAWRSEAKEQQQQFAFELCEDVLNTKVVDNEDFEFIDTFTGSIKDRLSDTSVDSIGEYFKHGVMFVVVLGYGIVRVIQIKQTGIGDIRTWTNDVVAVCLMVCILLPSVIKIVAIERVKQRLKQEKILFIKHLTELERIQTLYKKSVRLVQETEVINRGFTLSTAKPGVISGERQCPALRKTVFKCGRKLMLKSKQTAKELMKILPLQDILEGGPNYLCLLPLQEYGPCVNLDVDSDELLAATDCYALPAVKGMVSLWQSHVSEWLRIVSVYCLLSVNDLPADFCKVFTLISSLQSEISSSTTQLEHDYLLHKCHLGADDSIDKGKRKPKDEKICVQVKSASVAVNSLILHIKSAFNRLQKVEKNLDTLPEDNKRNGLSTDLESELTSDLKVIKCDLDACQECWSESVNRINKKQQQNHTDGSDVTKTPEQATTQSSKTGSPKLIPIFEMGDPVIEDQVFEAYTDPTENYASEAMDDISDDEKEKKKQEAVEAVRVLNELKSVITVRAEETRQREIRAIKRMKGENDSEQSETNDNKAIKTEGVQSETNDNETVESAHSKAKDIQIMDSEMKSEQHKTIDHNQLQKIESTVSVDNDKKSSENDCEHFLESEEQKESFCRYNKGNNEGNSNYQTHNFSETQTSSQSSNTRNDAANLYTSQNNESLKRETVSNKSSESLPESNTPAVTSLESDDSSLSLKERLERLHGNCIPFATNIANLAVAKSHQMTSMNEDTFGDEDSDSN